MWFGRAFVGVGPSPLRDRAADRIIEEEPGMAADDKIDNKTDQLKGKAKETVGKATDDDELEAKGKKDQTKGDVKQAGEKLKDAVKGD
jgi:uncharacterized protein YjbJ (UPF0337 family)